MQELINRCFGLGDHARLGFELLDGPTYIVLLAALIVAITVHEFGHAWMADLLGDPGPRQARRVTLSPFAHLDPLGTLLLAVTTLVGFPVGWGRPVRTSPEMYSVGEKTGTALVALMGPTMNLLTAIVFALPLRALFQGGALLTTSEPMPLLLWVVVFMLLTVVINLSLFVFNLVPLFPLDGSYILAGILPEEIAVFYRRAMTRYGVYILLTLLMTGVLPQIVMPVVVALFKLLLGIA